MRRRPNVKLYFDPRDVSPGERLRTVVVLSSTSETPVDFVTIRLRGSTSTLAGQRSFVDLLVESGPMRLTSGDHRLRAEFDLPASCPPSYIGRFASIDYVITINVSIPWWIDRKQSFRIPVTLPPSPPLAPVPKVFVSRRDGPRGKEPYMELSLDATQIALGDEVSGSISIQNLGRRQIEKIDLSFVVLETIGVGQTTTTEVHRFRSRVFEGQLEEGMPIRFRVGVPMSSTPTLDIGPLVRTSTLLEVRAQAAWASDIVLAAPVFVGPRSTAPRTASERVAPVGREREMVVWQQVATKVGLVADLESRRMIGRHGGLTIAIASERRDFDSWLVAKLGWASLGLDLEVTDRRWTDAFVVGAVRSGDPAVDGRFRVHAREELQAKVLVAPEVLGALLCFEAVKLDDAGGELAVRGASQAPEVLESFARNVLRFASTFGESTKQIPPPAAFLGDVQAWVAAAARLRGRLELGRMWIHGAQVGTNTVEIGSMWSRSGLHVGSVLRVAIDPPLETVPANLDDPALSPASRDKWRELRDRSKSLRLEASAMAIELEGKLSDPEAAMPLVELAVALCRALRGNLAAGPFR